MPAIRGPLKQIDAVDPVAPVHHGCRQPLFPDPRSDRFFIGLQQQRRFRRPDQHCPTPLRPACHPIGRQAVIWIPTLLAVIRHRNLSEPCQYFICRGRPAEWVDKAGGQALQLRGLEVPMINTGKTQAAIQGHLVPGQPSGAHFGRFCRGCFHQLYPVLRTCIPLWP